MKMTEPKLLSECGTKIVIDDNPGDQYLVEIDAGDYLVIRTGATLGKRMANFTHPNMAATTKSILEFKHYRKGGGKFWTSRAGIDFYFVIPRSAVKMLPEKGYSYIPAEINGVKVKFNVSGGGGSGVWADYLHTNVSISVNHKISDLKKLAEVAVRNSPMEPIVLQPMEKQDLERWNRMSARVSKGLIETVAEMVYAGKKPVIKFLPGYGVNGVNEGKVIEVERRRKKIPMTPAPGVLKAWRTEYTGAVNSLILEMEGTWKKVRAKVNQIDWAATAEMNGIAA